MATTRIDVRLGETATRLGELLYEVDGVREASVFTYHRSWLEHPRAFPIAPDMPLTSAPFYGSRAGNTSALPGAISDSTADSWGRAIIKAAIGRRNLTDLDFLIEADDFLRSGALRYFDGKAETAMPLAPPQSGERAFSVPRLLDLEQIIAEARAFEADPIHFREKRAHMIGGGLLKDVAGTLGGARPKVNARDENGNLWIVKLAKMDDIYAVARAEVLTLHLADAVGIQASEARILNTSQKFPVALIKRFDRSSTGGRLPMISAQTFMGLPGTEPSTYVDIADRLRAHGGKPGDDNAELWRRMAYSILIQNVDDHLRNHAFLRGPGGWCLSRAFDINPDPNQGLTLKTAISESHGSDLSVEAAVEAAPFFDISEDVARARISEMASIIEARWREIGGRLGMTASDLKAVSPAFENSQVQTAIKMA